LNEDLDVLSNKKSTNTSDLKFEEHNIFVIVFCFSQFGILFLRIMEVRLKLGKLSNSLMQWFSIFFLPRLP